VVSRDEATKDVLTVTEGDTAPANLDPSVSRSIEVPVLLVNGELDALFICTPTGPPCTAEALRTQEAPFYRPRACLQLFVLADAGHSLTLFPNARRAWRAVAGWVDEVVGSHPERVTAPHPAGCRQPAIRAPVGAERD
jgi:pimeloyl-ACP methyl ester carboxylesterase